MRRRSVGLGQQRLIEYDIHYKIWWLRSSYRKLEANKLRPQIMTSFHFVQVSADRTRQLTIAAMAWLAIAAGAVFLFFFNPAAPANQWFPKCPFLLLTGYQCPGCGSTRACYQLLHLHPIAAFKFNPLMMLTLPFIVYGFLGFTRSAITGKPQRRVFIPPFYMWSWLILMIFFWIFRNTPWYPFSP